MSATYPAEIPPYPVRVQGHLGQPSRWSWLAKWFLAIPHALVLALLWPALVVSSAISLLSVAATGRYPRSLFDFNLGVMRWSWRVAFYAYGANGTDSYPPFTLAECADYPARLEIPYPEHQRRGLPLIGWWLAGAPQYVVVAILMGGGVFAGTAMGGAVCGGLIGLLVLTAAVVLLFRGAYPQSIFDLVLGLDRWVLRVVAYAAVMTSEYPPFRLDTGAEDLAGPMLAAPPAQGSSQPRRSAPWSSSRIAVIAMASVVAVIGVASIAAGGTAVTFDKTQRNASGYLMTGSARYSTAGYALMSGSYPAGFAGDRLGARDLLGTIHLRVRSSRDVFVGIARADAAEAYLAGVARAQAGGLAADPSDFRDHLGGAPGAAPATQRFWAATTTGKGVHTLDWKPRRGSWRVVVMNANGTAGVDAKLSIGATAPHLLAAGEGALGLGIVLLALSAGAMYLGVRRSRS